MRKLFFLLLPVLILSTGCNAKSPAKALPQSASGMDAQYNRHLQVGDKILAVQIVTASTDMQQGLSGRSSMKDNQGMLFNYGASRTPNFWMKGMKFDLDFIWIKNNKVISVTANIPAPKPQAEGLPTYSPPSPIDEVLEVNAGWTEQNNIATGDVVKIQN